MKKEDKPSLSIILGLGKKAGKMPDESMSEDEDSEEMGDDTLRKDALSVLFPDADPDAAWEAFRTLCDMC